MKILGNKANLRNLIAATGPVILLKLGSNGQFSARVTLQFDRWPQKIIAHLFYTMSSFAHNLKSISEFGLELHSGNPQFWSKLVIFVPCDLEIWQMTLENNRPPLVDCIKLSASFQSYIYIYIYTYIRIPPGWWTQYIEWCGALCMMILSTKMLLTWCVALLDSGSYTIVGIWVFQCFNTHFAFNFNDFISMYISHLFVEYSTRPLANDLSISQFVLIGYMYMYNVMCDNYHVIRDIKTK